MASVTPDRSPSTFANVVDLYRAYAAELPKWFHRLRLSRNEAQDATQKLWLFLAENPDRIPANVPEARDELSKLASNIARSARRSADRDNSRQAASMPDDLPGELPDAEQITRANELREAIDQLDQPLRDAFIGYKIVGYSGPELASMMNVHEDTILKRVWRASGEIQKKLARKDDSKRGVLIAPAAIEIPIETRAAFCAIWSVEGRMPDFGGPKDPPPPPPPWFSPVSYAVPAVPAATKAAVSRAAIAILLVLLVLVPVSIVAIYYFWDPLHPNTARTGLHVPQTPVSGEINDVVDAYPAQAPTAPSARASAPTTKQKPSQALDDDALQELEGPGLTRSGSGSE